MPHQKSKEENKSGLLRRNSSVSINDTRIAGLYDLEHTIGKGHFAVVKLARHVFTGEKVAVKVIDKTKLDPDSAADLMKEVRCMKLVQHPNIVRLYEVIDTQTKLFLILELGDYDMYDYIMKNSERGSKESDAQQYFSQIIKAIDYCHALHVVHRDLKPENVVFFEKLGMIKLTDFGFSNLYTPGQQLKTSCGSLAYSAPEILLGDAYDAPAVDIWSLGVILYMLVCGRLPFHEANDSETLTRILDCRYTIPDSISPGCKDLIQKMLVRDPQKRASLDYIVNSAWVRAGDRGHAEVLPLVLRGNLPESAHATIVEQMVAGGIGSEDSILNAIEQGEYSYLTATYYLLAERVLSAYREEQALLIRMANTAGEGDDDEPNTSQSTIYPSRSRSNSWRGPVGRRACTILKEESEEELSSYLRSPSRQSSRYFRRETPQPSRALITSRTSSLESFRSVNSAVAESSRNDSQRADEIEVKKALAAKKLSIINAEDEMEVLNADTENSLTSPKDYPVSKCSPSMLGFSGFGFDELSPIREMMEANSASELTGNGFSSMKRRSTAFERQRTVSSSDEDERRQSFANRRRYNSSRSAFLHAESGSDVEAPKLARVPSEPIPINQSFKRTRRLMPRLLRRNSSPSVAMFGPSGLRSSCDRVSPQAIQDLLEFSRLNAGMKRALSPDSRISSRSPSPPCSSGRTSPAISTISGIVARLKSSALTPVVGGMRKLSSSPHLLGICEENDEEISTDSPFYTVNSHKNSLVSNASTSGSIMRGVRSSSTGFALTGRLQRSVDLALDAPLRINSSASASFRVVRPRQNLVSPDSCRRYEQRFGSHRSRRSTSCSSSETSEEDSSERKLNLIGYKYCRRNNSDGEHRSDDEPPRDPNFSSPATTAVSASSTLNATSNNSANSDPQHKADNSNNEPRGVNASSGENISVDFILRTSPYSNENRYVVSMFPYPSGRLHMGHMRVYSISDVLTRYYKLCGYNVLHPIGWDAFGLPAENAARNAMIDAKIWTEKNIEEMRSQLLRTGVEFDWASEIRTCDPNYYKWTQWIFLKLYEKGLVHRRLSSVFWDPVDQTVLAAEQIGTDGKSWRSGAIAESRKLQQWIVETPRYAKRLRDSLLEFRDDWPEVAAIQLNWIGQCDVFRFTLPIYVNGEKTSEIIDLRIRDPTELERAEFIVVSSDHELADSESEVDYLSSKNVVNFLTTEQLPIVVLGKKSADDSEMFFNSRIGFSSKSSNDGMLKKKFAVAAQKPHIKNRTPEEILKKAEEAGVGGYQTSRRLRDWVVSRQRSWGTPIPMIFTNESRSNFHPYPIDSLPLYSEQKTQKVNNESVIESDTLDTFFDSSWYFLRYLDPSNENALADMKKLEEWLPIDVYVGGIEHADIHLFYARFICHFLFDLGVSPVAEPFKRLLPQGVVRGRTYVELGSGKYLRADEVEQISGLSDFLLSNAGLFDTEWIAKNGGANVEAYFEKMSKSKANGVDPLEVIEQNGLDMSRLQLLNTSAPRAVLDWNDGGLQRWIERMEWVVDTYVQQRKIISSLAEWKFVSNVREEFFRENYNYFVRTVSTGIEFYHTLNTSISRLQGLTNTLRKMDPEEAGRSVQLERCIHSLVIMLQVFAPAAAEQMWQRLMSVQPISGNVRNGKSSLKEQIWPMTDADATVEFGVRIMENSFSKIGLPRTQLEHLPDADLYEVAKLTHHKSLFDLLERSNLSIASYRTIRRPGLDILVDLKILPELEERDLKMLMKEIQKQRAAERKDAKRRRREAEALRD